MLKWTINYRRSLYAVFIFDKEFKIQRQSTQAKADELKDGTQEDLQVFDPRNGFMDYIGMEVKDKYLADLFLTQLFPEPEYTRDRKGLDWSKVLEKPKPGIIY